MNKICIKCEEELPATPEYFYRRGADKIRNECKKCVDKKVREWKQANPEVTKESIRKRGKKYYHKYLNKSRERGRNKSRRKVLNSLSITSSFEELMQEQGSCCKICKIKLEFDGQRAGNAVACIDHCHVTNTYRGILCTSCNKALGLFKDNTDLLLRAVTYLNGTKETT